MDRRMLLGMHCDFVKVLPGAALMCRFLVSVMIALIATASSTMRVCGGEGPTAYDIIPLACPFTWTTTPTSINANGGVTGYGTTLDGTIRGFLYSQGNWTDLGILQGGGSTYAYGLNNDTAAGMTSVDISLHACAYNGTLTDLGTLGGNNSQAYAINNSGQIAGSSEISPYHYHAFAADTDGVMTDLGALGGNVSQAYGINDNSQVVGTSFTDTFEWHAFLYDPDAGMQDLGTLGGNQATAFGINDLGVVVGSSQTADDQLAAFIYQDGQMTDLGIFHGFAQAINNSNVIVGKHPDQYFFATAAFIRQPDGCVQNLVDLIPPESGWHVLSNANAINDSGCIVGQGISPEGLQSGYLLVPKVAR